MQRNCQTSAGLELRGRSDPYRGLAEARSGFAQDISLAVVPARPRIYRFMASRCFRKELRRDILAFAAWTASVLVGCCFGWDVFITFTFPAVGIMGSTCVGLIE